MTILSFLKNRVKMPFGPAILMLKVDLLTSQMTRPPENLGLESCIIATTLQKADRRLLHFRLVRIAGINFLSRSLRLSALEETSLSSI